MFIINVYHRFYDIFIIFGLDLSLQG